MSFFIFYFLNKEPFRTKRFNRRLALYHKRLARGDFHPTLSVGLLLTSKSYYDAIEKIVLSRAEGCKHCMSPLIQDKERMKLKTEFRLFLRHARFVAYRYRKEALYRCHMTALILGENARVVDQLNNDDQENHIVTMMEHKWKMANLHKGK
jgi:hypothetical protein